MSSKSCILFGFLAFATFSFCCADSRRLTSPPVNQCEGFWVGSQCDICAPPHIPVSNGVIDMNTCTLTCSENWTGFDCDICKLNENSCDDSQDFDQDDCRCKKNNTKMAVITVLAIIICIILLTIALMVICWICRRKGTHVNPNNVPPV